MQWIREIDWTHMNDRMRSKLFVGTIIFVIGFCGLVGEYRLRKYVDYPWMQERDEILERIERVETRTDEIAGKLE